jgi:hypothetical protein
MNFYYILTGEKKQKILVSKNYVECYEFITKNKDTRIRKIDYSAKPRILDRREFLTNYIANTGDEVKFFLLSEILIKRKDDLRKFLNKSDLMQEYDKYKQMNAKFL